MAILDKIYQISNFITYIVFPLFIFFLCIFLCIYFTKKNKKGNIHLKKGKGTCSNGIIFGKKWLKVVYSPANEEGHTAVFGGSGVGKTSAILIPTLRSWTGTCFTIDISGDICNNVDMKNKIIYEPSNPETTPFNIFGLIDELENDDDKNEKLEELSYLLMPDDNRMADSARFFNTEGRKILTAALISFYHSGMDFIQICEKIVGSSWKELFNAIDNTKNAKAIQYINSFFGTSEKNTSGCKQAADTVLKLFATNERIKKTIRRPNTNEFDFIPTRLETNNVFIVVDDSKLKLYEPLLHILTVQTLNYFSNRPMNNTTPILFCLDEFASLGKMEITDALRKFRKKHIRILILTQSLADVDLIYGHDERMAMMNNFLFKVVLSAADVDTQEYFSKLIGYEYKKKYSTSSNSIQTTYTRTEEKEFIIEPADLAHLGDYLILLHPGGYIKLKKNFYYK